MNLRSIYLTIGRSNIEHIQKGAIDCVGNISAIFRELCLLELLIKDLVVILDERILINRRFICIYESTNVLLIWRQITVMSLQHCWIMIFSIQSLVIFVDFLCFASLILSDPLIL